MWFIGDGNSLSRDNACFGATISAEKKAWSIVPSSDNENKQLIIHFTKFSTERFRDKVKIYEQEDGQGALIAVLHGNQIPDDIILTTSSAYILFTSDYSDSIDSSFHACYSWI